MRRLVLLALVPLAALAGCSAACGVPTALDQTGAWVQGQVTAPAAWTGGSGGGAAPVQAAEVALADAGGQTVAGLFHQRTDGGGGFVIEGVPKGYGFVLVARFTRADGTEATLETLASPQDRSTATNITLGTTLATMLATDGLTGPVGTVDASAFQQLASQLDQRLSAGTPPADPTAALQQARDWVASDSTLSGEVGTLHQQAAAPKATAAQRDAEIAGSSDRDPLDALSPVY